MTHSTIDTCNTDKDDEGFLTVLYFDNYHFLHGFQVIRIGIFAEAHKVNHHQNRQLPDLDDFIYLSQPLQHNDCRNGICAKLKYTLHVANRDAK